MRRSIRRHCDGGCNCDGDCGAKGWVSGSSAAEHSPDNPSSAAILKADTPERHPGYILMRRIIEKPIDLMNGEKKLTAPFQIFVKIDPPRLRCAGQPLRD